MNSILKFVITTLLGASLLCLFSHPAFNKEQSSQPGKISFVVSAPAKQIIGESTTLSIAFRPADNKISVSVPVKSFRFTNNFVSDSLNKIISERFNNHYMESDSYPTVSYEGRIINRDEIDFNQDGQYPVKTKGVLHLHGTAKEVMAEGIVTVKNKRVQLDARLIVKPAEYGIRIPPYIGNIYFREVLIQLNGPIGYK